jgi:hypothetical protein
LPVDSLIAKVYPGLSELHFHTEAERIQYFSERVILAPKNVEVATINDTVQEYLTSEAKNYLSADSAFQDGGVRDDSIPQST